MPSSPDSEEAAHSEKQARKALDQDIHYLTSVTQMADVKEVVAREEVFAANGVKLIDKGIAISSALREHLLNHVLLKPIEQSLEVKDGVCGELLAKEASRLVDSEPYLRRLLASGDDLLACQEALRQLKLPDQLGFKLTVTRERLPWLFERILTVVLISHFLTQRLDLSPQQCTATMLAGLMHDLGELHTDPSLLDRRHKMSDEELRYIDVHPITGYLIAKEIVHSHPEVATAVLQHHEKLDGSGYPYRLCGEAIGEVARIISIADACASIISRFSGSERLSALMRLNRQKLDPVLIALLQGALSPSDNATAAENVGVAQIQAAAQLLQRWTNLSAALIGNPPAELAFLFERMAALRVMLVQFGLDPDDPRSMEVLIGEQEIGRELWAAFDEVRWQITDLQREIQRRREAIGQALSSGDSHLLDAWLSEIRDYLRVVTPHDLAPASERRRNLAAP